MSVKVRKLGIWWVAPLLSMAAFAGTGSDLRLVDAAKNRDHEAVHSLLKQHVDVNTTQADGATALAWAAHWDDMETADLLIRAGANVNAALRGIHAPSAQTFLSGIVSERQADAKNTFGNNDITWMLTLADSFTHDMRLSYATSSSTVATKDYTGVLAQPNQWYFVVITYDGSQTGTATTQDQLRQQVYVNGQQIPTAPGDSLPQKIYAAANAGKLYLGAVDAAVNSEIPERFQDVGLVIRDKHSWLRCETFGSGFEHHGGHYLSPAELAAESFLSGCLPNMGR